MNRLLAARTAKIQDAARPQHGSLLLMAAIALLIVGCSKGTFLGAAPEGAEETATEEKSSGSGTLSSDQLLQKGGRCDVDRQVTDPEGGTDEWLIYRLYELALGEDNKEAFEAFRALFPSYRNTRDIKENYWQRIRKNVHNYLIEPDDPGYTICRIRSTDKGKKYYITPKKKSQYPVPIEIGDDNGELKILKFTPF